jgi:hypothetical protein
MKIISLAVENLVTPKAGAKHELLFNKPASVLGATKFTNGRANSSEL